MILIIVASSGKNLELAGKFANTLNEMDGKSEIINLVEADLPLYSAKEEAKGKPEMVLTITEKMKNAKGVIFASPEYNGGIPPMLTNLIAWISRSTENWRECFNEKPALIATHSGSGGANVLFSMRSQLSYLGMNVIGRQIQLNKSRELNSESLNSTLTQLVKLAAL